MKRAFVKTQGRQQQYTLFRFICIQTLMTSFAFFIQNKSDVIFKKNLFKIHPDPNCTPAQDILLDMVINLKLHNPTVCNFFTGLA